MKRFALVSLAVLTFMISFSEDAFGCECVPAPLEKPSREEARTALVKDFNGAAAIFSGKVVEANNLKLRFEVDRVWKGHVGKQFVMSTGTKEYENGKYSFSGCDYNFKIGEEYLVYAYPVDPDRHLGSTELQARQCTRTRLLKDAEPETRELEEIYVHPIVWRRVQKAVGSV